MQFVIEPRGYDDPDVVRMVDEVQQEYVRLYGGPDAAMIEPREFVPPGGLFLVGVLDGTAVATGGWRRVDEGDAEIKRMYVSAPARRLGLARQILAELEQTAARAGYRRLILSTGPEQPEAVALYEQSGYTPTARFGHYARYPNALFYAKELRQPDGRG